MFYCSQPLEAPEDPAALEVAFRSINAPTQLVWGSNFPSHEFDVPATIWDLPFLSEDVKKAILGGNAMRLFDFNQGIACRGARSKTRFGRAAMRKRPRPASG